MYTDADHRFMSRALELAAKAMVHATPNPRVGCVVVREGRVIGQGFTQRPGSNHAEIEALLDARRSGHDLHGAHVYVTLEPCAHFGRTPPCATALIEAHVTMVIAAVEDPNPQVGGRGLEMLRQAGIDVRCGLLKQDAIEMNAGFFSRMTRGRPWVRIKVAASLDGRTALDNGASQWITSEAARADGHAWRARSCAVLSGIGTVRADDPTLSVRLVETPRQPLKVLVDSRFEVALQARLFDGNPVLVACTRSDPHKAEQLAARNVEVVEMAGDASGKVDLEALMRELARRGINELHVEAGSRLNGSLVQAGLVDELLAYLAPCLIGPGQPIIDLPAVTSLTQVRRLTLREVARVGDDVRLLARTQ
ncbi:MAG TPA: bifunctional diaminohydroxyphosphoribosylaminopyrimidine deaminase/5-amino-6-(5-phosphoribosylamino)uracil reductase RibD [Burkholderiaceae bacterium]|nr:bifunctional diaminohydroxyphosphoribosylaminopyrimidine deaminase/5-amino-6-(5-phosphoribosylamino)uracil reductase RibD [Burkholderiaceae bacterium]